jgi:hypothetical protein
MQGDLLASLRRLSDTELVARVKDIAARERADTVLLVAHLAELDTRDVHLRAGHGSLFAYCRDVLALSEQEAYSRIAVARAARRFPVVLEMLEAGALNHPTVKLLGPLLTPENHRTALESAVGKSKLQVEEIAARLWPKPDARSFVRKLPAPSRPFGTLDAQVPGGARPPASSLPGTSTRAVPMGPAPWPARGPSAGVTPLSPDRYKVQVTIGGDTLEKLRLAKDLLRHAVPTGDEAAILDRALTALLVTLAQRKFAAADNPRPSGGTTPGSRHIPAEVKRAVWLRDIGRCAFVGTNGRRCTERGFLEFHHVRPYAVGGEATAKNIQLRCRNHNDYEARVYFGQAPSNGGGGVVREPPAPLGSRPLGPDGSGTRSGTSRGSGLLSDSEPHFTPTGKSCPRT